MALTEYASIDEIKRRLEDDCKPFLVSPLSAWDGHCLYERSDIEDILNTVPTIDLTEGHAKGEWLDLDKNFETKHPPLAICSCCESANYVDVIRLKDKVRILTRFCGRCGAELEYKEN